MNPLKEKAKNIDSLFMSLDKTYPKPYDKNETDAYSKTRVILMNGTEFEQVWFSHGWQRHEINQDLRRDLAVLRKLEQQQQKLISCLKPIDETILETTIGYEQLAVDLTACMARAEKDPYVKGQLDFALLEDFDHLYRYADLLEMDMGIKAEELVNGYTDIMPGRPTISEHRHPFDAIRKPINSSADLLTKLHVNIITAAEQQTMNYYMNVGSFYKNDLGRKLYAEIAMIEEQHVSEYGSLLDVNCTMLESLVMHEYTECYLYYSCYMTETNANLKKVWEMLYEQEVSHLHYAIELLQKYEKKDASSVIGSGDFPMLLDFKSNIDYIRDVMKNTIRNTADKEEIVKVDSLPKDFRFFTYQEQIISEKKNVPSHAVIDKYIKENGEDYRYESHPHPIDCLKDRCCDNTSLGREA